MDHCCTSVLWSPFPSVSVSFFHTYLLLLCLGFPVLLLWFFQVYWDSIDIYHCVNLGDNLICVYIAKCFSLQDSDFTPCGYTPSRGTAGSYGNFIFKLLRHPHTVLHSGGVSSCSHPKCTTAPFSAQPHQLPVFGAFKGANASMRCNAILFIL